MTARRMCGRCPPLLHRTIGSGSRTRSGKWKSRRAQRRLPWLCRDDSTHILNWLIVHTESNAKSSRDWFVQLNLTSALKIERELIVVIARIRSKLISVAYVIASHRQYSCRTLRPYTASLRQHLTPIIHFSLDFQPIRGQVVAQVQLPNDHIVSQTLGSWFIEVVMDNSRICQ